jgi:penicillin-binding protein 1A
MADAYATIASGGYRNRPTAITKITFPDGKSELPARFRVRRTRAFSDGVTAEATRILKENVQMGTGTRANIGCPAAGKTGTTDNFTDAWFVGFTPRLATAVWVGYPKSKVEMRTEYHGGSVAGGTFPAEIWHDYMSKVKGKFCGDFPAPKTPFQASPFFGRYSHSGGRGTGDLSGTGSQSQYGTGTSTGTGTTYTPPPVPVTPAPAAPDTGGKGKSGGKKGFNPDLYESPPQGPPATNSPSKQDSGGGAQAPPG